MAQALEKRPTAGHGGIWPGVGVIVVAGLCLGLAQNGLMRYGETQNGLKDYQRRSLDWVKRQAVTTNLEDGPAPAAGAAAATTPAGGPSVEGPPLPAIPSLPHPIQMQLAAVKAFVDRGAAAIIDARTREEYAEGHIPGAVNLPFDEAVTDPAKLESFDAGGRPIIIYCGGGTCETSMSLAFAMLQAGQKKLLVYMGGFPEWQEAGYPVALGSSSAGGS